MTNGALLAQMANFDRCILERDGQPAEAVLDPDFVLVFVGLERRTPRFPSCSIDDGRTVRLG